MKFLTTGQAAKRLGVSQRYINALIHAGRLKATPLGEALRHDSGIQPASWLIEERDLDSFAEQRKAAGRPAGSKTRNRKPKAA